LRKHYQGIKRLYSNPGPPLSLARLERLIVDLPALRERFTKIPSQIYAHLSDQLEFLSLFVEEQVAALNPDLDSDPVAEAACALLYFERAARGSPQLNRY
jgi:hypothetical protein